ncbi:MAG TPA: transcription antitermination factor NusB, partial [Edaphobacter sp.]|nr:transcription antitermination factor NusB [Edaphobacter sp.]
AGVETAIAKITPARLAAFEILKLVGEGKGHSDELLHSSRVDALSPEDRNLTTALVMGVLRWQIALDARVRGLLQRPEQRLAEQVAIALRMGAFQLLHLERIPAHAALSESVELCRAAGEPHATGMVNAVLRKLAAAQRPGVRVFESTAAFAERLGHPLWMVERWVGEYGREVALKICEADQQEPAQGGMFSENGGGLPHMDDGSRLVAEIAAAAMPGARRVWDCCAAPGGKTLILARRLGTAEIVASDVSAKRLAQTEARLQRYSYAERVRFAMADATDAKAVEGSFDLILCDAPCSGTGTLAGNPEIRHRLKVEELARQSERQTAILKGALKRLAPGGRLVYSTCSLEPEECERMVEAVVGAGGVRMVPVEGLMAELGEQGILLSGVELGSAVREGALRTLPGVHGCDGFYAVVMERD